MLSKLSGNFIEFIVQFLNALYGIFFILDLGENVIFNGFVVPTNALKSKLSTLFGMFIYETFEFINVYPSIKLIGYFKSFFSSSLGIFATSFVPTYLISSLFIVSYI